MPWSLAELTAVAMLGLVSGLMIGCIGIGGVILVPALVWLGNVPIQSGIPAAMLAYIMAGLIATAVFARNKSIDWSMAAWLCAGAAPTAFIGAWAVSIASPQLLEAGLGLLTFLSGLNALRGRHTDGAPAHALSSTLLLVVGAATGFLSSISGTGGPLVLVPILMSMSVPVLTSVGLSQAIQLPIAITATAGNALYGELDLILGGTLAASLTAGSWYGARLAHSVPRAILRRIVSIVLVVLGACILGKVGWQLLR